MGLIPLTRPDCADTIECPRIYLTDRGTLAVQGLRLEGEAPHVEIPAGLVSEALRTHRSRYADRSPRARGGHPSARIEPSRACTLVVHGSPLPENELAAMKIPAHEAAVEIPFDVLEGAHYAHRAAAD